jgi:hypothetical protein
MRRELGIEERRSRVRRAGAIPTASLPLDSAPAAPGDLTLPPAEPSPRVPPHAAASVRPMPKPVEPSARWVVGGWLLVAATALAAIVGLGWWWVSVPEPAIDARRPSPPATAADERPAVPSAAAASAQAPAVATTAIEAPAAAARSEAVDAAPSAPPPGAVTDESAERAKPAPATARPIPKKSSPDPRCTEIIARVSLGEALSAQDQATLQRECRK